MALSADAPVKRETGDYNEFDAAAAATIYEGSMVGLSGGYARALTAGDPFVGHAEKKVDNSTGSAADERVRVLRGRYRLQVTVTGVTRHDVGRAVYASDDATLKLYRVGSRVGKVIRYVTTNTAIVEFVTLDADLEELLTSGRVVKFFDDFVDGVSVSETADAAVWNATLVDGDSDEGEVLAAADDYAGGALVCTTNDKDNDLNNLQVNGEAFKLASGKRLYFESRFKLDDIDTADWFVGLAITDATVVAGASDTIGFRCPDNTGDIDYVAEKDTTETTADTDVNLTDDTEVVVAFYFNGTSVTFYVNGAVIATATTNIPDDEALTPTLEVRNASAAASTLTVDYVKVVQER